MTGTMVPTWAQDGHEEGPRLSLRATWHKPPKSRASERHKEIEKTLRGPSDKKEISSPWGVRLLQRQRLERIMA